MKVRWQTHRKWLSQDKVFEAFKNRKGEPEARTWPQLNARVPGSTLSRALRDLIKEGNVKVSLRLGEDGQRETIYELVHEWHTCKYPAVQATYQGKVLGTYPAMIYKRRGKLRGRLPEDGKKRLENDLERGRRKA